MIIYEFTSPSPQLTFMYLLRHRPQLSTMYLSLMSTFHAIQTNSVFKKEQHCYILQPQVRETCMYCVSCLVAPQAAANVRLNSVIIVNLMQKSPSRNSLPKCHTSVPKETVSDHDTSHKSYLEVPRDYKFPYTDCIKIQT
jgi:hypothetical protein